MNPITVIMGTMLSLVFTLVPPACSQTIPIQPSISIGSVEVSLGMSRDHVYQLFKAANLHPQVTHFPNDAPNIESWTICEDGENNNDCDTEGQATFRDGRLILAVVRWAPKARTAADVADALVGAVRDFSKRGLTHCDLDTPDDTKPNYSYKELRMTCAGHSSVELLIWKSTSEPTRVQVQQSISEKGR